MLRKSLSVAADAAGAAAAPAPKPRAVVASSCRRAPVPPSAPRRRRHRAAAPTTTAAAARPLLSATTTTAGAARLPASWPLGAARRGLAPPRAAATEAAAPSSTAAVGPLLAPRASDALPAVERALAAVAAAAAAQGAPPPRVAARVFPSADGRGRLGLVATADAREGDVLFAVPESLAATAAGDAGECAAVADFLAAGRGAAAGGGGGGGDDDGAPAVGELVALALWVMAQRAPSSSLSSSGGQRDALVAPLPAATLSPVLWPEPERGALLRGSPALQEARDREAALRAQWARMVAGGGSDSAGAAAEQPTPGSAANDTAIGRMGEAAFLRAFCAVVASAAYLPSAGCFALVPVVSSPALRRTCAGGGCSVDYDEGGGGGGGCAVLRCGAAPVRAGDEVTLEDGRPNGEFLLATGALPGDDVDPAARPAGARRAASSSSPAAAAVLAARVDNPSDCLVFPAALLPADRLFAQKAEILAAAGLDPLKQAFPVRRDALPTQLLSFLRLARVQDAAQFARVSFEADVIVSQVNEYEVLQLLMGDCRDRLSAYDTALEEECKYLQGQAQEMTAAARAGGGVGLGGGIGGGVGALAGVLGGGGVGNKAAAAAAAGGADGSGGGDVNSDAERRARERLAARLRAAEKAVLSATTDAVRRRLAPIRGVPTKGGGMRDPNSDLREIFEALEGIPSAPARALDTVRRWSKGEFDPEWNDKR